MAWAAMMRPCRAAPQCIGRSGWRSHRYMPWRRGGEPISTLGKCTSGRPFAAVGRSVARRAALFAGPHQAQISYRFQRTTILVPPTPRVVADTCRGVPCFANWCVLWRPSSARRICVSGIAASKNCTTKSQCHALTDKNAQASTAYLSPGVARFMPAILTAGKNSAAFSSGLYTKNCLLRPQAAIDR